MLYVKAYLSRYVKGKLAYTQKQIDKFNRQKYITELEKVSKNLFRMLRDTHVQSQDFVLKFEQLKN